MNPRTCIPLTFIKLMVGFKKWSECTATSPSGCHLGTYKSMLKDLPKKDNHFNAGFSTPVLENTTIPWSTAYWVDTLHEYLHQIGGQILLQQAWTPKPQCSHDQSIMEALLQANFQLSTHELKIINNVHICLQANTLSNIVNNAGTHIWKECVTAAPPLPNQQQFYHPNHSLLRWPQHAKPSPKSWRLWSKIIQQLFSTSSTTKLTQPLGRWNQQYDQDYEWNWCMCPMTYHLYHHQQLQWFVYKLSNLWCTYVQYHETPKPYHQYSVPITPATPEHILQGVQITLPKFAPTNPIPAPPLPKLPLIQQLTQPPQPWAKSLWHQIRPYANLFQLHATLGQGRTVFLVNASVNHCRQGTMTWIIHSKSKLWSGEGIVPGPVDKLYSGLAEAYGVLTVLSFLQHYIQHLPTTYHSPPQIYVCCTNQGASDHPYKQSSWTTIKLQSHSVQWIQGVSCYSLNNAWPGTATNLIHPGPGPSRHPHPK